MTGQELRAENEALKAEVEALKTLVYGGYAPSVKLPNKGDDIIWCGHGDIKIWRNCNPDLFEEYKIERWWSL